MPTSNSIIWNLLSRPYSSKAIPASPPPRPVYSYPSPTQIYKVSVFGRRSGKSKRPPGLTANQWKIEVRKIFDALPETERLAYRAESRRLSELRKPSNERYRLELEAYKRTQPPFNINYKELNLPDPAPEGPKDPPCWTMLAYKDSSLSNFMAVPEFLKTQITRLPESDKARYRAETALAWDKYRHERALYKKTYSRTQIALRRILTDLEHVLDSFDKLVDLEFPRPTIIRTKSRRVPVVVPASPPESDPGWSAFFDGYMASVSEPYYMNELITDAVQIWKLMDESDKMLYISLGDNRDLD